MRTEREILADVRALAVEYYELTGKPLGVTGEIAEFEASEKLGLELAPPRTEGYDATHPDGRKIQIKGRRLSSLPAKPGQRMATILLPLAAGVADAKVKKTYATSPSLSSSSSLPRKLICSIRRWPSSGRRCLQNHLQKRCPPIHHCQSRPRLRQDPSHETFVGRLQRPHP